MSYDYFNNNKLILSLIKESFVKDPDYLIEVVESFSREFSPSRTSLCEAFRLFGNAKYTWFGGGEEDIKALCQGVMTGYQDAHARHFKNDILKKVKIYITENNKDKFFNLCQSIYRSAQQNAPVIFNMDNEYQFINEEEFYEFEEESEAILSPIFGNLLDFYIEITPWAEEAKVKAGNVYKKKVKKSIKKIKPLLFEGVAA
jgi:hypothetical protein